MRASRIVFAVIVALSMVACSKNVSKYQLVDVVENGLRRVASDAYNDQYSWHSFSDGLKLLDGYDNSRVNGSNTMPPLGNMTPNANPLWISHQALPIGFQIQGAPVAADAAWQAPRVYAVAENKITGTQSLLAMNGVTGETDESILNIGGNEISGSMNMSSPTWLQKEGVICAGTAKYFDRYWIFAVNTNGTLRMVEDMGNSLTAWDSWSPGVSCQHVFGSPKIWDPNVTIGVDNVEDYHVAYTLFNQPGPPNKVGYLAVSRFQGSCLEPPPFEHWYHFEPNGFWVSPFINVSPGIPFGSSACTPLVTQQVQNYEQGLVFVTVADFAPTNAKAVLVCYNGSQNNPGQKMDVSAEFDFYSDDAHSVRRPLGSPMLASVNGAKNIFVSWPGGIRMFFPDTAVDGDGVIQSVPFFTAAAGWQVNSMPVVATINGNDYLAFVEQDYAQQRWHIRAVRLNDGQQVWTSDVTSSTCESEPAADLADIVVQATDTNVGRNRLYAFSLDGGGATWQSAPFAGGGGRSAVTLPMPDSSGNLCSILVGGDDGNVRSFGLGSGSEQPTVVWDPEDQTDIINYPDQNGSSGIIHRGYVALGVDNNNKLLAAWRTAQQGNARLTLARENHLDQAPFFDIHDANNPVEPLTDYYDYSIGYYSGAQVGVAYQASSPQLQPSPNGFRFITFDATTPTYLGGQPYAQGITNSASRMSMDFANRPGALWADNNNRHMWAACRRGSGSWVANDLGSFPNPGDYFATPHVMYIGPQYRTLNEYFGSGGKTLKYGVINFGAYGAALAEYTVPPFSSDIVRWIDTTYEPGSSVIDGSFIPTVIGAGEGWDHTHAEIRSVRAAGNGFGTSHLIESCDLAYWTQMHGIGGAAMYLADRGTCVVAFFSANQVPGDSDPYSLKFAWQLPGGAWTVEVVDPTAVKDGVGMTYRDGRVYLLYTAHGQAPYDFAIRLAREPVH